LIKNLHFQCRWWLEVNDLPIKINQTQGKRIRIYLSACRAFNQLFVRNCPINVNLHRVRPNVLAIRSRIVYESIIRKCRQVIRIVIGSGAFWSFVICKDIILYRVKTLFLWAATLRNCASFMCLVGFKRWKFNSDIWVF